LLLYPDCPEHCIALDKIKVSYDYAYILHDKDIYTEEDFKKNPKLSEKHCVGEIKKPHWHVVITVGNNACWNTAIANELGIIPNYIEKCGRLDRALEYLIHYNDSDKYQYDVDEVQGNLKTRLKIEMNKDSKNEGEKVVELIEYIDNQVGYIRIKDFSKFCASNGYWEAFRRSGTIFIKMIEEHNKAYYNAKEGLDYDKLFVQ
jgi:hypothetical protein